MEALIEVSTDIDVGGRRGRSPIFEAADRGEHGSLNLLLKLKADPSLLDIDGRSPLHAAAYWGRRDGICQLLMGGASLPIEDGGGARLCKRAKFCLERVQGWDALMEHGEGREGKEGEEEEMEGAACDPPLEEFESNTVPEGDVEEADGDESRGLMENGGGDEEEVLVKEDAIWELDKVIGLLTAHCGKKNEGPTEVRPKASESIAAIPEYQEVFNPEEWKGEDMDLWRKTPRSNSRPSSAGTYVTSDQPSDDGGSWTGGEWSDDEFVRDPVWADPFDHMTAEWCKTQRKLWVTYVIGLDRLANAHEKGQGHYPYAISEVRRGIKALHALREVLEFKNTRQYLPDSCPLDQFGKALPENMSEMNVILRPGAIWRYEYQVELPDMVPLPSVETWSKVRNLVDGRPDVRDRTKYCPITLVALNKDTLMYAPRRSPILENGRSVLTNFFQVSMYSIAHFFSSV